MTPVFSIREVLRSAYNMTKAQFFPLLGIMVVLFAFQIIVAVSVGENKFIQLIAQVFVMPGFTLATLSVFFRVVDGQKPEFTHLTDRFAHYLNFITTNILYGIAVLLGFILLIIPGIYLSIRLMYALTVVAEKNLDPMEALRVSGVLTHGIIWELLGFNIILGLVNVCGALLLGFGLLFTIPMTTIALLLVYKKLSLARLTLVGASESSSIPNPPQ
jgi:hypothetical protein